MRSAKTAVLLAVTAVVLSSGWLLFSPDDRTAAAPDAYALDLVVHTGRYWADASALGAAEDELVTECMNREGFRYPPDAPASPAQAAPLHGEVSGVDLAYRREHGYGLVESAVPGEGEPPPAPLQAGYDRALTGARSINVQFSAGPTMAVASGGCRGRARATLAGTIEHWAIAAYAADYLNDDLIRAVADDPAMTRAAAAWRACMSTAGYPAVDYSDPRDLIQQALTEHGAAPGVAAEERRVAVADGECQIRARVIEVSLELRRAAALRMPATWTAALVQAADLRRTAADNARRWSPA
ncbi:hypothetical protein DMB66_57470 [Actinoplanes sp. ATCC 53533]|uniref:hypothetical protein n=1 Tax=Actinoplanes sp. ATCC 53533 TaxID=1288362 RepID=UPI000F78F218|nr:hypothetical protein [Actinoplanes sp. ATCC 53533]RSM40149.1 hypothetical protein DMB66_57470 [Actinoplanes sp. ATCC 53533]